MPTDAEILARAEARDAADEVYRLACDEVQRFQGSGPLAYWQRLLKNICAVLPPECHPTRVVEKGPWAAMTTEERNAFEKEAVPFGKWDGVRVADVPLSYFDWLDAQPDFRRKVNRYLRHSGVQIELEDSNEDRPPIDSDDS